MRIGVMIDTERPFDDGFVVTDGVPVGAHVVTSAVALLLARESNADTDAD